MKEQIEEMRKDLIEIFDEEYEKRRLITPQNTAEKMNAKGYRKQSEGEWILTGSFKNTFPLPVADFYEACSVCRWIPPKYSYDYKEYNFCPKCGAKMKGGAE